MRKLEDIKYVFKLSEVKPDSNTGLRLVTEYLSFIEDNTKVQTNDGVIHLIEPYNGPQLKHNDSIIFTGRMLGGEFLEGSIEPITREAVKIFKEYAVILKNRAEFLKEKTASSLQQQPYEPIRHF